MLEYTAGGKALVLYRQLEHLREAYPPQALFALMNLLSSHDQTHALHALGWQDDVRDPPVITLTKQRLKLAVFFRMTYPGAPSVYYGDEVGVTGGDNPYNRATYPWADLGGQPDTALLAEIKTLIKLRHDHAVLRRGSLEAPLFINDHVIVWARRHQGQVALVSMSNGQGPRALELQLPPDLHDAEWPAAYGATDLSSRRGRVTLHLPALGAGVWLKR